MLLDSTNAVWYKNHMVLLQMTTEGVALQGEREANYYHHVVERFERGETLWVRRNFDTDLVVFDLFVDKKPVGCVVQDEAGGYEGYLGNTCVTGGELVPQDIARSAVQQAYDMSVEQG